MLALARQAAVAGARAATRYGGLGTAAAVGRRELAVAATRGRWVGLYQRPVLCFRAYSSSEVGDEKEGNTPAEDAEAAAAVEEEEEDEDSELDSVNVAEEEEEEDDEEDDDKKIYSRNTRQLLPREVVTELDRFIVGQSDAKRAVAIALRNRWRRKQLAPEVKEEIMPKNILMIGPTGVGKTGTPPPPHPPLSLTLGRDREAAGEAGAGALHQGRGHQVHGGGLPWP